MADATAKFETAQALFCAIVDYVGLANIPDPLSSKGKNITYSIGKTKYKGIDTYECFLNWYSVKFRGKLTIAQIFNKGVKADATFKEVDEFLRKDMEWYLSSTRIAIKLLTEINTITRLSGWKKRNVGKAGWQSVMYRRGDQAVMGTIDLLWREANKGQLAFNATGPKTKGQVFGDINKWNPADIYWSTKVAVDALAKELKSARKPSSGVYKFDNLNKITRKLIASGDLLPLSLKKNARGEISIVLVNWNRKQEMNSVATYSAGALDPPVFTKYTPQKLIAVGPGKAGERKLTIQGAEGRRDFSLHILVNGQAKKGMRLKCRHDAAGSGPSKWLVQIFEAGKNESAGSLVGRKGLVLQMNLAGDTNADSAWGKIFAGAETKFKETVGNKLSSAGATNTTPGMIVEDGRGGKIPINELYRKGKDHKNPKNNEWRSRYVLHAGNASGIHFANGPIAAFHAWLVEGKKEDRPGSCRTDRFIQNVYLYATSRSNTSGQFVIGK